MKKIKVKIKPKCNHKQADSAKGYNTARCPVCKKVMIKGKRPTRKNGAFGKPKSMWRK